MLLYKEAAPFLHPEPKQGSVQSRIFNAHKFKRLRSNPGHVFALVSSTLKFKPYIEEIVKKSHLQTEERKAKIPQAIALMLVHDLLFSRSGRIQSGKHPWKEAVIRNKTRLQAEYTKLRIKLHVKKSFDEIVEVDESPVRWFRANTLKTSAESVKREFGHLEEVSTFKKIQKGQIYYDPYIPNLFGVSPREKITSTDAYLKGRIIIQDRSSCFPAYILNPIPGVDHVIDATAAPGNKTTHLACILEGSPRSVIAFEKDNQRVKTLKKMCEKAGGMDCISIHHADFTTTNPEDFPEITGMLVDPSCSGSGIFGRAYEESDHKEESYSEERLEKLSNFQFAIVKHAMMFPKLNKLVYSTCSIYPQEDERVVGRLLQDEEIAKRGWHLAKKGDVIPTWPRRGKKEEFEEFEDPQACADACVRSLAKVDGGIGFFAASFKRDNTGTKETKSDSSSEPEWKGFAD